MASPTTAANGPAVDDEEGSSGENAAASRSPVYYAVRQGKSTRRCIYLFWEDAQDQVVVDDDDGGDDTAIEYEAFQDVASAVFYIMAECEDANNNNNNNEASATKKKKKKNPIQRHSNNAHQNRHPSPLARLALTLKRKSDSPPNKRSRKRSKKDQDAEWEQMLQEFIKTKDRDVKKSRELYRWINAQRTQYKQGDLSDRKIARLEEAGFEFNPKVHTFEERLEQLKKYKEQHGNFRIPGNKSSGLGGFVSKIRTAHKKYLNGEKSSMTAEREEQLKAIGFVFEAGRRFEHIPWDQRFRELKDFKKKYGHLNVPFNHGTLGNFVKRLRNEYTNLIKGRYSALTLERLVQLNTIGFMFDASHRKGQAIDPTTFTAENEQQDDEQQQQEESNKESTTNNNEGRTAGSPFEEKDESDRQQTI